jgi:hypothetical protein
MVHQKTALSKASLSEALVTLQTKVTKKRNRNYFLEQPSLVTNKPRICLDFVISFQPRHMATFVRCSQYERPSSQKVYNCFHMLQIHPGRPQ